LADFLQEPLAPWFVRIAALVFGAAWGSFFNVAIYRWPRGISVVTPASFCPECERPIPVRLNIPVISYFLLRGKTACCGARLSPRYPLVEAAGALLCLGVAERYLIGAPPGMGLLDAVVIALSDFVFVGGLLVASFVDLDFMEIPEEVALPVAALGLATASLRVPDGVDSMVLGAGCGYLLVQVIFVWTYERLTGRRGMGEGDSKLMLMIGAFVGWQGAVFSLLAGATQGLAAFLVARLLGRDLAADRGSGARGHASGQPDSPSGTADGEVLPPADTGGESEEVPEEPPPRYFGHLKVPFGPFLALSAVEYLFMGDRLLDAFLLR
jgi:leader peptidase (prepilin peptidase)/N-methyltransferase